MTARRKSTTTPEIEPVASDEAAAVAVVEQPEPTPIRPELTMYQIPAADPGEDGYIGSARWVRVPCAHPMLQPPAGYQPLWAELDLSLSIHAAEAIPDPATSAPHDLFPHVCPRVRAWNVKTVNPETGKVEPVPPPLEIGAEAFKTADILVLIWVANTLRGLHLQGGPNRGKGASSSQDGQSSPSAAA